MSAGKRWRVVFAGLLACSAFRLAAQSVGGIPSGQDYLVYVLSESADRIGIVRFSPSGTGRVERTVEIGLLPHVIDGPHGIALSPDGESYFVSTAHGTPFGSLWKLATKTDSVLGRVELGMYPATVSVSPDGAFAFVVNFNLQGEMVPSSVSIVSTQDMIELARPRTCVMPHGSRVSPDGAHHYSACMMSDMLVEIDTRSFGVSRHFMLAKGSEHGMRGSPSATMAAGGDMSHGMTPAKPGETMCSPTWAQPSPDGSRVFVACNKANDIVEVDVEKWEMKRRIPAGDGVYNLAVTPDGALLLSTNKRGQSVSVIDLATGKELARVATKRPIVHGVTVSPDGKYAFVTEEGLPRDPGTVEMIDLATRKVIASVDVGAQAAGVEFWRTEPRRN